MSIKHDLSNAPGETVVTGVVVVVVGVATVVVTVQPASTSALILSIIMA